jgi:hypothetical protein
LLGRGDKNVASATVEMETGKAASKNGWSDFGGQVLTLRTFDGGF